MCIRDWYDNDFFTLSPQTLLLVSSGDGRDFLSGLLPLPVPPEVLVAPDVLLLEKCLVREGERFSRELNRFRSGLESLEKLTRT